MVDLSSKGESLLQAEDSTDQPLIATNSIRERSQTELGKLTLLDFGRGDTITAEPSQRGRSPSVASATSQSSYHSQKDALRHRILHLLELLRVEKTNRDDNTSCYVELVSKADREKAPSIRQAFERINQRSSANIAHLEQRLQDSCAQLKALEQRVWTTQDSSSSATSAQQQQQHHSTARNSFSRLSPFHLPRIRTPETNAIEEAHLPPVSESKEHCPVPEPVAKQFLIDETKQKLEELKAQLVEVREDQKVLEDEWHKMDEAWKADKQQMMEFLQEEKRRHYNLEVQVNDVIQINLNEITNLKQDLACTEEKMVYQSYERTRDIWEVLESYQTRLAKMEMQQQAQQQEARELPRASIYKLYGQLMNLLLSLAAILLVCASTVSACALPLLRTRRRAMTTLFLLLLTIAVWNYFSRTAQLEWKTWLPSN